jgi:hypothetical protein
MKTHTHRPQRLLLKEWTLLRGALYFQPFITAYSLDDRYYVTRADTIHTRQTSQLIYRSFFRPLTRVRYDLIGQDWVLEQLFRVLSMHSQRLSVAPIVVLLCGVFSSLNARRIVTYPFQVQVVMERAF